jgi:hypothetical protein
MNPPIKYPIFEVEENAFLKQKILPTAIPQTDSRYFQINRRFNISEDIVSKELIDCMGIYEEGDWWCLTVIKIIISDDQFKYIFLPLTSGIVNVESPTLKGLFDNQSPLVGLITNSAFYGERHWILYDAIANVDFVQKLIYLFFPTKGIPENHPNLHTVIQDTEFGGKFDFHLLTEITTKEIKNMEMSLEFIENNNFSINYENTHQIILYRYLREIKDVTDLINKENVIGYITYSNLSLPELLIGILVKL